jgi:hypothetical protein
LQVRAGGEQHRAPMALGSATGARHEQQQR